MQRLLRRLSGDSDSFRAFQTITGFDDPAAIQYNYGFSLTQLMFTPDDAASFTQPPGERRYAGWLGLGFSLHVKDDRILNSVEFTVGPTGSRSEERRVGQGGGLPVALRCGIEGRPG